MHNISSSEKPVLTLQERIAEIDSSKPVSATSINHHSDGQELIPAEVQAKVRRYKNNPLRNSARISGVTVDDEGVSNTYAIEPEMYVDKSVQTGFTPYAEMMNGRFAMLGFVALLLTEVLSGHSLVSLLLGQ